MEQKQTVIKQVETLAATVRPLQPGEYYTVDYNRPYGAWAYRCFRSAKAAARFIVKPESNCKNVSQRIKVCHAGYEVK